MTARRTLKALTAFTVLAAWAALGYGLLFSPSDVRVWDDLDAGGRFGLTLDAYLPYYALTLPIALIALISLFPRPDRMFPLAGAMGLTALFAVLLVKNNDLHEAQPDITIYTTAALALTAFATIPLLTAHHARA